MELNLTEAKSFITDKFRNAGDFDFMNDEDMGAILSLLLSMDSEYLDEIEEGDDVYDEEIIFDRMLAAVEKKFDKYKSYLMRFVDDYMDFMEQYLVSIDAIEWD